MREWPGEKVGTGVWGDEGNSHELRRAEARDHPMASEDAPKSDQLLVNVHSNIFAAVLCWGLRPAMPLDGAEQRVIWSGERALGAVTESKRLAVKTSGWTLGSLLASWNLWNEVISQQKARL